MTEVQSRFPIPAGLEAPIWEVAKFLVLFGLLFYLVFAVLVIRQAQLMTRTLTGQLDRPIRVFSWIHFALAVAIFLLALIVL